jgi:RNA polymerase sigma-70 factor (ECF subfamily)
MQRELVERARSGDLEAFSDLARDSLTRLYAVAILILRDPPRAEDAVQDALLHAWQHIEALRDPDAFGAWIHRITVRACYKAAKKERRRISVEVREVPDPQTPGEVDPSKWIGDREQLFDAIGRLPIDQRAVMVVHYYLDLPLTQAAEILDIPVGTAKSRLHHGLTALRRTVRDEGMAEPRRAGEGAA